MIKFPFTSFQQFNLDWIMQMLHKILDFMPLNGVAGDVLQRTVDGAAWQPLAALSIDIHSLSPIAGTDGADELPIYDNDLQGNYKVTVQDLMLEAPVQSVNAQTGDVVLSIPSDTADLTNTAGFVDAAGAAAAAPVQSVNGQTGNVTVSAGVASVNGQTGTVVLSIPTDTSDLTNGAGFVDTAGAAAAAPVQSVNGQTGNVTVSATLSATLLWTNSNELQAFSDQTVSQDLTDYSFLIVEYVTDQYVATVLSQMFPAPTHTPPVGYSSSNYLQGIDLYTYKLVTREVKITSSGITFGSGQRIDTYAGTATTDNTLCRPLRIWGIA